MQSFARFSGKKKKRKEMKKESDLKHRFRRKGEARRGAVLERGGGKTDNYLGRTNVYSMNNSLFR